MNVGWFTWQLCFQMNDVKILFTDSTLSKIILVTFNYTSYSQRDKYEWKKILVLRQ